MFVGHLPFVGKLVAHLIAGNENIGVVSFTPGTVVCLERDGNDIWSVAWVVRPELLKSIIVEYTNHGGGEDQDHV